MDISLSEEDLKFKKEVDDFMEEHLPKGHELWSKRAEWFAALKEKGGWDIPNWPEEFGGPGWSATQHWIWDNVTSTEVLPPTIPFGVVMLAPIIMKYGSKEQQERFLPDIRDNKVMWCQGYSEPGAGSDLASLKTKAELSDDGTHYLVNGTKIWTTMGHVASMMFCLTRTDNSGIKQEGVTFLLLDMNDPGIEVKPIITLGGSHHVNQVFFTDVKVPVENRIGDEGQGWTYAKGLLQHERKGIAGITRSIYSLSKLKEKAQRVPVGDKNLMDDPDFKKKIAVAEIELLALEYTEMRCLADMVNSGSPGAQSSILKLKGTEMQQTIQALSMDAAGIYGSPWGKKVGPKFAKGAMEGYLNGRPATIYGGCSEVQKDVIAKRVLGIG